MKQLIFYASYLCLPFLVACLFAVARKTGAIRWLAVATTIVTGVIAYSRFIEPNILQVKHAEIVLEGAIPESPTIKIALFSDTHFGVYKNAMPMQRIVERINRESPDAVMIAGDFLYHLSPIDIPRVLAPLADLHAPVFAVLGNHDVGFPGPIYTKELYAALQALKVNLVENRATRVNLGEQELSLIHI